MAVPEDIRAVPRPVNTIVDDNGGDGPKRFAIRQRGTTKYIPGGNPQRAADTCTLSKMLSLKLIRGG